MCDKVSYCKITDQTKQARRRNSIVIQSERSINCSQHIDVDYNQKQC